MGVLYIISLVSLAVLSAVTARWLAKLFGKNPRFWFWISIPLPVFALCILLCLPELTVEDEELSEKEIIYIQPFPEKEII